jgi:ketosteroid isomerase-like protein
MSRENVEVVQRALDAFNRRDLEAVERFSDPEVEMDWSRSRGVEAGIYRGQQAVRGFWSDFLDIFDEVTVSPEEFLDLGDRVVVPTRARMRSRDGIEVQTQSALVVTLRDRRIVGWCLYQEKAEALEAVGLRE